MTRKSFSIVLACLIFWTSTLVADWDAGVKAFQDGKYSTAEKAFRELVDAQPDASQGHYMLGLSLLRQKNAKEAIAPLSRAVELSPEQVGYRLAKARAELDSGDARMAVKTLAGVDPAKLEAKLKPSWVQLLEQSSREMLGAESAEVFEKAVASVPDEWRLWVALGRLAPKPERSFEAAAEASRLDAKNDELARWAVGKALALADSKSGDEKLDWYKKAAELAGPWVARSPSADSHLRLGQSLMGSHDYAEARKQLEAATKAGGGAETWYELGRCSLALKRTEDSLRELDTALAKKPASDLVGPIDASRGAALRRLERFDEAGEAYRKAGLGERVAEMDQLAKMKAENDKFSDELAACKAELIEVEKLEEENKALQGTSAWESIERQREIVLRRCQHYFEVEEPSVG